jgi:hypothetical protein
MVQTLRALAVCVVAVVVAVIVAAAAPGGVARADSGTLVFTRMGSVLERPADGGDSIEIAHLPDDASEVRFVEATRDGKLMVLDMGSYSVWLASGGADKPMHVQGGPCTGRARPSPMGDVVVCQTAEGSILVAAARQDQTALPDGLDEPQFRGPSGSALVALADVGVVGFDKRKPDDKEVLAKSRPRSHLFVSPNGEMAAAVYGEGAEGRIRTFLLDGEGVPRQLGGPGIPTLWSWDSSWIMFQEGDIKNAPAPASGEDGLNEAPPDAPLLLGDPFALGTFGGAAQQRAKKSTPRRPGPAGRRPPPAPPPTATRVCVARATGGEVKCWDNFTGMAFSPDSTLVLLKRDKSLYVGKIAGVRPDPPVKILDGVDGAATWVPGGMAAGIEKSKPATTDFEL